jgi:hypothetical protein
MVAIVPFLRRIEQFAADVQIEPALAELAAAELEFERLKTFLDTHKPFALAG